MNVISQFFLLIQLKLFSPTSSLIILEIHLQFHIQFLSMLVLRWDYFNISYPNSEKIFHWQKFEITLFSKFFFENFESIFEEMQIPNFLSMLDEVNIY